MSARFVTRIENADLERNRQVEMDSLEPRIEDRIEASIQHHRHQFLPAHQAQGAVPAPFEQRPTEKIREFHQRFDKQMHLRPGLHSYAEIMTIFMNELTPPLKSVARSDPRKLCNTTQGLSHLINILDMTQQYHETLMIGPSTAVSRPDTNASVRDRRSTTTQGAGSGTRRNARTANAFAVDADPGVEAPPSQWETTRR